jgi:DNA-binding MarR family transcriptional regulator
MSEKHIPQAGSDEHLMRLFHRASKWMVRGHLRAHFHGHDPVRHAQGHILAILGEHDSMSQRELLEVLHIRSASLSELLIKLEKNGFIVRRRNEKDKRNFLLQLTELGRVELIEHHRRHQEKAARLFSVLSEAERESLCTLLTRLLDTWEAEEREWDDKGEVWGRLKAWLEGKGRRRMPPSEQE